MPLIRLHPNQLPVGVPLPWAIFGKNGSMLLNAGSIVPAEDARELLKLGLYRVREDSSTSRNELDLTERRKGNKPELPGLALAVETMQIGLLEEGNKERTLFRVEFLGMIPDVSVIVSHPQREGRLLPVGAGQNATVKMFVDKHVHAFVSQILCVHRHPAPHLHLAYPDAFKTSVLRGTHRVRLRYRILALLTLGEEMSIPVSIIDLSNRGLALLSEYPLGDAGVSIGLSFSLLMNTGTAMIRTEGIIRSSRQVKVEKAYQYGVELPNLTADQQTAIERFLYSQL